MTSRNELDRHINFAIGQVIRRQREKLGFQQKDCARYAHIDNSWLCQIEYGDHAISVNQLIRLAPILKMSPGEILDEAVMPIAGSNGIRAIKIG